MKLFRPSFFSFSVLNVSIEEESQQLIARHNIFIVCIVCLSWLLAQPTKHLSNEFRKRFTFLVCFYSLRIFYSIELCVFRNQKCQTTGRKLSLCTISRWTRSKESQYRWKSTSMCNENSKAYHKSAESLVDATDVDFFIKNCRRKCYFFKNIMNLWWISFVGMRAILWIDS